MDDKGSLLNVDGPSVLKIKVACPPPGIGAKKVQETSEARFGTTYIGNGSVALECAIVDLRGAVPPEENSTALEVACPPPGIGAKKVQETSEARLGSLLTSSAAELLSNMLS
jgi:hypothetical protein